MLKIIKHTPHSRRHKVGQMKMNSYRILLWLFRVGAGGLSGLLICLDNRYPIGCTDLHQGFYIDTRFSLG